MISPSVPDCTKIRRAWASPPPLTDAHCTSRLAPAPNCVKAPNTTNSAPAALPASIAFATSDVATACPGTSTTDTPPDCSRRAEIISASPADRYDEPSSALCTAIGSSAARIGAAWAAPDATRRLAPPSRRPRIRHFTRFSPGGFVPGPRTPSGPREGYQPDTGGSSNRLDLDLRRPTLERQAD